MWQTPTTGCTTQVAKPCARHSWRKRQRKQWGGQGTILPMSQGQHPLCSGLNWRLRFLNWTSSITNLPDCSRRWRQEALCQPQSDGLVLRSEIHLQDLSRLSLPCRIHLRYLFRITLYLPTRSLLPLPKQICNTTKTTIWYGSCSMRFPLPRPQYLIAPRLAKILW